MQKNRYKIVVADDSAVIVKIISNLLAKRGYTIHTACDGTEAIRLIGRVNPDLVILDIMMPGMSGLDVCKSMKNSEKTRFIPVIILTSSDSRDDKNQAISVGANDYLNKPWDKVELILKVESLLRLKNAIDGLETAGNIILALTRAVEAKDRYTEGHAERVSLYASKIARKLKLSDQQVEDVITASLLHDIGKIGIPDIILNKPDKVSDMEFDLIKQHTVIGEEICSPIKSFNRIKKIVRHHHEKLDGTGYPDGISGEAIGIETRIVSVVDIYDALTSSRLYREPLEADTAISHLEEGVNKGELDKDVVYALKEIVSKH